MGTGLARVFGTLMIVALVGCGEQQDRSFCEVYAAYIEDVTPTLEADPTAATAADAEAAVDDLHGDVLRLRAVADSRYAAAIDELADVLDDLRRTLASFDGGDTYDTWEPLVGDTITDAVIAHQRLVELVGESCDVTP